MMPEEMISPNQTIILTESEADQVRGISTPGHGLHPREFIDGNYGLPIEVLDDPAHAKHHAFLRTLPTTAEPQWREEAIE